MNMSSGYRGPYAHSIFDQPEDIWEPLSEHLARVADKAAQFANSFGAGELGNIAGWLHDYGKLDPAFQQRLRGSNERVDHAAPGAALATELYPLTLARILAAVVAGHHAGLADGVVLGDTNPGRILESRIAEAMPRLPALKTLAVEHGIAIPPLINPPKFNSPPPDGSRGFRVGLFTRMLFSALIDADRLETEAFYDEVEKKPRKRGLNASLGDMRASLNGYLDTFAESSSGKLKAIRAEILAEIRSGAARNKGAFSLSVPTGGGKTLASLAFALDHAELHDMRRVIVVIPFTSIVEQTSAVYRKALAPHEDSILEHHSAFDDEGARETLGVAITEKLQLATQNWDAPLVVTTAVQFFESLFANRTAKCRKLHNIANSVIILDEAQIMPSHLLRPCVLALEELTRNYGCSVVLSTATQPPLQHPRFEHGLRGMHPLIADPTRLAAAMQRVAIEHAGRQADEALAGRIAEIEQVLVIVNTRAHARRLFGRIRALPGARHLSTLMCAAHRTQVLDGIRSDLNEKRPCRVISTSLIEAGVDVDFATVLRAEAGLDQIVQAAGRCNRESKRTPEESRVVVFEPEDGDKLKVLRTSTEVAQKIFRAVARGEFPDVLCPAAMEAYFRNLYFSKGDGREGRHDSLDERNIIELMNRRAADSWFPFETVATRFRMIEQTMAPLIVDWEGGAAEAIAYLKDTNHPFPGDAPRRLQRYLVNLPIKERARLVVRGAARVIRPDVFGEQFVVLDDPDLYTDAVGLDWTDPTFMEAEKQVY